MSTGIDQFYPVADPLLRLSQDGVDVFVVMSAVESAGMHEIVEGQKTELGVCSAVSRQREEDTFRSSEDLLSRRCYSGYSHRHQGANSCQKKSSHYP